MYKKVENPFVERTNWDWEIDPEGLRIGLRRITKPLPHAGTDYGKWLREYDKLTEDKTNP